MKVFRAGFALSGIVLRAVLLLISFCCGTASAAEYPDCSKCHKVQFRGKNVHPIILSGGCVACHTRPHEKEAKKQRFLFATGVDLCFGCHERGKFGRSVMHPPVARGECLSCHDPHASDAPKLLVSGMPDLCFTCHEMSRFLNSSFHPPVAEGRCTACHDPHSSGTGRLLHAKIPDLCFTCHDANIFNVKKRVHGPVGSGQCMACHEPHVAVAGKLLRDVIPEICFRCHARKNFEMKNAIVKHTPEDSLSVCMKCHEPHQSDSKRLLTAPPPELCFQCHDKKGFARKMLHPPSSAGMCLACHEFVHSGGEKGMLPVSINKNCLQCHPDIGKTPHATGTFKGQGHPLDGRKEARSRSGRLSCASCHDPHSSEEVRLFRYPARKEHELCSGCHAAAASRK